MHMYYYYVRGIINIYIYICTWQLQQLWRTHVQEVVKSSDVHMWRVFCSVRTETRVCQSSVLRAVRPMVDPLLRASWPKDRRALDRLIANAGGFRSRILRSVKIDMTDVGHDAFQFTFIDPLYAWASAALRLSHNMPVHFQFRPLHDPDTGERLYGTSVKCGEVMKQACARVKTR